MKKALVILLLSTTSAYAEKKWTHLPDGRWMFVEQNNNPGKICDMQGKCYPDGSDVAPQAVVPHNDPPHAAPPVTDESQHVRGVGCGRWPTGSDADLECKRMAQLQWRRDPDNNWVQIDPRNGRWSRAPTGPGWQWVYPGEDWRRDPAGRWQVVPGGGMYDK